MSFLRRKRSIIGVILVGLLLALVPVVEIAAQSGGGGNSKCCGENNPICDNCVYYGFNVHIWVGSNYYLKCKTHSDPFFISNCVDAQERCFEGHGEYITYDAVMSAPCEVEVGTVFYPYIQRSGCFGFGTGDDPCLL